MRHSQKRPGTGPKSLQQAPAPTLAVENSTGAPQLARATTCLRPIGPCIAGAVADHRNPLQYEALNKSGLKKHRDFLGPQSMLKSEKTSTAS